MDKILERINLIWGGAVALLSMVFGEYWFLFLAFALLNIVDYVTGWVKARYFGIENSVKGLRGILKKLGYWIVIGIAFFVADAFIGLGKKVGFDLGLSLFIGWFTLATFIINEIRSVLENLVRIGVEIPEWLVKGLEVAGKRIDDLARKDDKDDPHTSG